MKGKALGYGTAYFLSVTEKTTGIASINKTQLSAFPVVLPPLDQQQDFARHAEAVEFIARQQVGASSKAEASFDALAGRRIWLTPICLTPRSSRYHPPMSDVSHDQALQLMAMPKLCSVSLAWSERDNHMGLS